MFIVNPAAARGKCARVGRNLEDLCRDRKLDFNLVYTSQAKEAEELARQADSSFNNVVAVGGDGTVHEVANGLVGGQAVFGVIPVGSGNDFVRALNIPIRTDLALATIIAGNTRRIDVGKADDVYFPNGLGIGFDSWVVEESGKIQNLRGNAIYLYAVLKTIYRYKPPLMQISYNDIKREERFFMITAGNGVSLGGGFKLTPEAQMDDGLLDLNIICDLSKADIYRNLISVYSGSHTRMPQVTTGRTTSLIVESDEGFAVHLDGELLSLNMKSLHVTLVPKALEVLVP